MKKTLLLVLLVLIAGGVGWYLYRPAPPPPVVPVVLDQDTLRRLETGDVIGFTGTSGSHTWRGIPFAEPPVRELRWREPVPERRRDELLEALANGSLCTQFGGTLSDATEEEIGRVVGAEDCLYLNIFAPPFKPGEVPGGEARLPVMVWIHGGGNSIGHGGSYDGGTLAVTHDLVVVAINYRLGPFGWFTHPALRPTELSRADRSGNYGTLDVIRALQWVRVNIERFGGDPGNVTIFGESAGGTNVLSMLASPLARGLFDRAIVQSGGYSPTRVADAERYSEVGDGDEGFTSREVVNRLLIAEGRAADRAAARALQDSTSLHELAKFLRGLPAERIFSAYDGSMPGGMIPMPTLFTDGFVLPRGSTRELFANAARYNPVPVILGTNRDEMKLFMVRNPEYVKRLLGFLPRMIDEDRYRRDAAYASDLWKVRGVDSLAEAMRESQGETVYAYRFDWDEEPSVLGFDLGVALGAAHGLEIAFVFNRFDSGLALGDVYGEDVAARDALSRSMMSYWAEFAYSGAPGRGRDGAGVAWEPWQNGASDSKRLMVFDTAAGGGVRMVGDWLTVDQIKERLAEDASFATQAERCDAYRRHFSDDQFDEEEYAGLGGAGC